MSIFIIYKDFTFKFRHSLWNSILLNSVTQLLYPVSFQIFPQCSIKGYLKITNEFSVGKWKVISVQWKFIFIIMNYYIQFQSLIKCFKVISGLRFEGFAVWFKNENWNLYKKIM